MAEQKRPGDMILQKIKDGGYKTYTDFRRKFTKETKVTLSGGMLSRYIRGTRPSKQRFEALVEFLGFSPKEQQEIEGLYLGTMKKYSPDVRKRSGYTKKASSKERKPASRIPLVSGPGARSKKSVKVKKKQTKKTVVKKTKKNLYAQLAAAYKTIMGKAPTKRAKVLIFELSLG